jgi:hypothetical protein
VYGIRVQRRIFGPKEKEVLGSCRKFHTADLRNFYASKNIISMIKSRRFTWVDHVGHMEK